jgi:hypothetical protein
MGVNDHIQVKILTYAKIFIFATIAITGLIDLGQNIHFCNNC